MITFCVFNPSIYFKEEIFIKKLSNVIILLLSIFGYGLLLFCLGYYCLHNSEVSTSVKDIVFTFVAFGILTGFFHIMNIAASIVALNVKFRGSAFMCMGMTITAFGSTWLWNYAMVSDAGTTMQSNPLFVAVWLLHGACSVAFCIVKFIKRW